MLSLGIDLWQNRVLGAGGGDIAARPTIIPVGDSRVPVFTDPATKRQKGATDLTNVACALADQKYRLLDGYGISGATVPQYLVNLNAAIAQNPGAIFFPSVLNSLAAGVSGADIANLIIAACDSVRGAGILAIVGSEMGSTVLTAPQITEMDSYNALIKAYCDGTPGAVFLDFRPVMCTAATGGVIQAQYRYDQGHLNQLGAIVAASSVYKPFLDSALPVGPSFILGTDGLPLAGGYTQLALNPRFAVTSGGGTTTGVTGTIPGNCNANKTGANVACAVTSALENVVLNCTFSTGVVVGTDNCRLNTTASNAAWNGGDVMRAMALVELTAGASGLAGLELNMTMTGDSVTTTFADMVTTAAWAGPTGALHLLMMTQEYAIPTYTAKGSLVATVLAKPSGVGAAQVTIKQIGLLKKVP